MAAGASHENSPTQLCVNIELTRNCRTLDIRYTSAIFPRLELTILLDCICEKKGKELGGCHLEYEKLTASCVFHMQQHRHMDP